MFQKKNYNKEGLPMLWVIYLVIIIAIFGWIILNFEVSFVWLRNVSKGIEDNSREYIIAEARRASEMMENSARNEMNSVEELAYNIALAGLKTENMGVYIENYLKKHNHSREVSIIDMTGQEINIFSRGQIENEGILKNYAHLELFELAKEGETYLSRVNYNNYSEPYVVITSPIRAGEHQETMAVLKAHYFLRGMWEIALEMHIGETGRLSVVDEKGMLIADPRPTRVLQKVNLLGLSPTRSAIRGDEFLGEYYLNENGVEVFGVGIPVKIHNHNWGAIVEQDTSEMNRLIIKIAEDTKYLIGGNVAIILILLFLAFFINKANNKLKQNQTFLEAERQRAIEEKNKTNSIIANFVDPVIVIDSQDRLALLNEAALKVLHMNREDIGKKINRSKTFTINNLRDFIKVKFDCSPIEEKNKKTPQAEEMVIYSDIAGKDEISNPFKAAMVKDTNDLVYKVVTAKIIDEKGVNYGFMKIFYDLTREKKIDRLKSEFISIAAHQLRTPLSAVKWALQMVLDEDAGQLNGEQREFLHKGYESNERIIQLVNDMLNVSRIEEGRFDYSFAKMDFLAILQETIKRFESRINFKKIKFSLAVPKSLKKIEADKEKLELVLQNLIENAVKYTPERGTVEIKLGTVKDNLVFSVKDNGVGIPKADQLKLFSKFFRGDNVVRMQTEGSGLGLFLTKKIIESHGGALTFTSEEGMGTEFKFSIPFSQK